MALIIHVIPTGLLEVNTTILIQESTREALVFDPGGDVENILANLQKHKSVVKGIFHTHAHFDHILGTHELLTQIQVLGEEDIPVGLHPEDGFLWANLDMQMSKFGIVHEAKGSEINLWLDADKEITLAGITMEIIHTPGHSPGSVSFFIKDTPPLLICGDVLFRGSIGRTDLWKGNFETLMESITQKIFHLPDNTRLICGHGPGTTVGDEKVSNPFVLDYLANAK